MKQWEVGLNNTSFDKVSITKDCQDALCEYIWNSFEANASKVEVVQDGEFLKEAVSIQIIDNGIGIEFESLQETFGAFLSTMKNAASIRIKSKANQGKGRFSYITLANQAKWSTVYKDKDKLKSYIISMHSAEKRNFETSDVVDCKDTKNTGTTVEFPLHDSETMGQLTYTNIKQKLLQEFSWYLYLNKAKNFSLNYMGNNVDYDEYVDINFSADESVQIGNETFQISLIVWKKNIDNKSKVFYLGQCGKVFEAENTGFNNNTVDFFHNVFVVSSYINSATQYYIAGNSANVALDENAKTVFSQVKKQVNIIVAKALKKFMISRADKELSDMEMRGVIPVFSSDEYGQLRKKDFQTVTKELYCVEPKIFHNLKPEQEKSLLGFLNLLLSSDERENILSIVENVIALSSEQRKSFANILQRTKLQYILDVVSTINKRLEIISQLKGIVFDMAEFANERDHIQKIVEQHFWLFGEQYHMLTADKTLATSLLGFEEITNMQSVSTTKRKKADKKKELNQRADIFLYTQRIQEDSSSEMLIVELKAPLVKLSLDVYNQVISYANTIKKEKGFNATNRSWRFYAICSEVDEDVKDKYKNFKHHGKNGLVDIVGDKFEIYALSWDDVFQSFEARHSFMLEKLKIDYTKTSTELGFNEDNSPSRDLVNEVSSKITALKAK